jgi:methionine salvage enolase-phosphatase E1
MEKEQEEKTKAMIQEMLRQEHAKKSQDEQTETLQKVTEEQQKEIKNLKKLVVKMSGE